MVIGDALALVVADADVLARIAGPLGDMARTAQRELARLDATDSRQRRAAIMAAVRAPVPPGLRGIDASWIEDALARVAGTRDTSEVPLVSLARRVVADGPTTPDEVWLARWACNSFPPMPPCDAAIARPRSMADAVRMSGTALRAWLEEVGADQLAFAMGTAASALSPRLAAALVRIGQAPRSGELGDRRAAIARARVTIDDTALVRVGARAVASAASELERLQLALRLPKELGIAQEMTAFAGSGGPSWRALAGA